MDSTEETRALLEKGIITKEEFQDTLSNILNAEREIENYRLDIERKKKRKIKVSLIIIIIIVAISAILILIKITEEKKFDAEINLIKEKLVGNAYIDYWDDNEASCVIFLENGSVFVNWIDLKDNSSISGDIYWYEIEKNQEGEYVILDRNGDYEMWTIDAINDDIEQLRDDDVYNLDNKYYKCTKDAYEDYIN